MGAADLQDGWAASENGARKSRTRRKLLPGREKSREEDEPRPPCDSHAQCRLAGQVVASWTGTNSEAKDEGRARLRLLTKGVRNEVWIDGSWAF